MWQTLSKISCAKAIIAETKAEASNRDALSFCVGMNVYISTMLAQYNPMLSYVFPACLPNYCTI